MCVFVGLAEGGKRNVKEKKKKKEERERVLGIEGTESRIGEIGK